MMYDFELINLTTRVKLKEWIKKRDFHWTWWDDHHAVKELATVGFHFSVWSLNWFK